MSRLPRTGLPRRRSGRALSVLAIRLATVITGNVFHVAISLSSQRFEQSRLRFIVGDWSKIGLGAVPGVSDREPSSSVKRVLVHVLERGQLRIRNPGFAGHAGVRVLAHSADVDLRNRDDDPLP